MLITNGEAHPPFVLSVISQTDMGYNYFVIQISSDGCVDLQVLYKAAGDSSHHRKISFAKGLERYS